MDIQKVKQKNFKKENKTMTKRKFSVLKLLTTTVLTMILSLSLAMPVFACGIPTGAPITGTETEPAEAAITKLFKMPVGTPVPEYVFNFEFTKESVNGSSATADLAKMPDIGPLEADFADSYEVINLNDNGVKSVFIETESIFAGKTWPNAGEFVYSVEEEQDNNIPLGTGANGIVDKLAYSQAKYEIAVYVKEKAGAPGQYYVYAIAARIIVKDDSNKDEPDGSKVNPQPGGDPDISGDYSKMIFTNYYLKNNGGTDPKAHSVLDVSKEVTGDYGDKTKYFQFGVMATKPATVVDDPATPSTYIAYVMEKDADGNAVVVANIASNVLGLDPAKIKTGAHGSYIEFTTGQALTVYLKHDQWLAFIDMPVGSGFKVDESANLNYTPTVFVTAYEASNLEINGTLSSAVGTDARYIGNDPFTNLARFVNLAEDMTPTGLSVNNLPFVLLIVLALGALSGYAVFKYRRKGYTTSA